MKHKVGFIASSENSCLLWHKMTPKQLSCKTLSCKVLKCCLSGTEANCDKSLGLTLRETPFTFFHTCSIFFIVITKWNYNDFNLLKQSCFSKLREIFLQYSLQWCTLQQAPVQACESVVLRWWWVPWQVQKPGNWHDAKRQGDESPRPSASSSA